MPNKPKPIDKSKTLDHARKTGDLEKFIREHEDDPEGDLDKLDKAIARPAQESGSATRKSSAKASSGD